MDKDAIQSMVAIGLLLIITIGATIYSNRLQLVSTRPRVNEVASQTLKNLLGNKDEAEQLDGQTLPDGTCPAGCTAVASTPIPAANRQAQWQSDPVPYARDRIAENFANDFSDGALESVYATGTSFWWRSKSENYRIRVHDAKTIAWQIPTTTKAYELTPDSKQTHPALRHPTLKAVSDHVSKSLKKIGFKQSHFNDCPVSENYDPFNNCVATFTHDDMKCSLIAGYGKYEQWTDSTNPYLRLELSCSGAYELSYAQAAPYLYAVKMIHPSWYTNDMAVYEVVDSNDLTWVDFGYTSAYFQDINGGLRLLNSDETAKSCDFIHSGDTARVACK